MLGQSVRIKAGCVENGSSQTTGIQNGTASVICQFTVEPMSGMA